MRIRDWSSDVCSSDLVALDLGGTIDMLVNNAGATKFAAHSDLDALSADDFLSIYRTNLVGAYQMIRAVEPAMKAAGRGAVVNVASIAGLLDRKRTRLNSSH